VADLLARGSPPSTAFPGALHLGTADPTTIFSGSSEIVGADFGAQVSGGKLLVRSGGTALDVMRARSATLPTCDSMVAG
jgi:hypothetical protein